MQQTPEQQRAMFQTEIDNLRTKLVDLKTSDPKTYALVRHAHENKIIEKTLRVEALDREIAKHADGS